MIENFRILLINPPYPGKPYIKSLGLGYLASSLEKENFSIKIIDEEVFGSFKKNVKQIIAKAKSYKPNLIGISLHTPYVRYAYYLIKELKKNISSTFLVAGGIHSFLYAEEVLKYGIDIAIIGEGELTILELVKALRENKNIESIFGLAYKKSNGEIFFSGKRSFISNLDLIPFPSLPQSLIKTHTQNRYNGQLITSRGCPGECTFCSSKIMGKKYRFRSAENIFKEMLYLYDEFKVNYFLFMDDTFTFDIKRCEKLCNLIIRESNFNPNWTSASIAKGITKNLLKLMKMAGCTSIILGIETFNHQTIKNIKKNIEFDKVREIVDICDKIKLSLQLNIMTGFPFENEKKIYTTLNALKEISPKVKYFSTGSVLVPYPGTEIYEEYKIGKGFVNWWLKDNFSQDPIKHDYCPYFLNGLLGDFTMPKDPILDINFFNYSKKEIKAMKKLLFYKCIHSMKSSYGLIKIIILFFLYYFSKVLYKFSPFIENYIFSNLYKIFLRFKRRVNNEKIFKIHEKN